MTHIHALNGLRGIAAYMVVLSHFSGMTKWQDKLFAAGSLGVAIFFIISGFLMGHLYLQKTPSTQAIKAFFIARIARVIPLYCVVVLISFIFFEFITDRIFFHVGWHNIWQHLLILRGESLLWTISVEVHFYLIFPLFWWLYYKNKTYFFSAIFCYIYTLFLYEFPGKNDRFLFTGFAHLFIIGILVSVVNNIEKETKNTLFWNALFLLFLAKLITIFPHIMEQVYGHKSRSYKDPVIMLYVAGLVYASIQSNWAQLLLGNKIMEFLGNISYSVYLWHMPTLWYIKRFTDIDKNKLIFLIVSFIVVTVIATMSYYIIEKPSRNYIRNRWKKNTN